MDPASLAATLVGAQMGRMQMAVAAKMMRMNADQAGSIAQLVDSAQKNIANVASVAAGIGQNFDINV